MSLSCSYMDGWSFLEWRLKVDWECSLVTLILISPVPWKQKIRHNWQFVHLPQFIWEHLKNCNNRPAREWVYETAATDGGQQRQTVTAIRVPTVKSIGKINMGQMWHWSLAISTALPFALVLILSAGQTVCSSKYSHFASCTPSHLYLHHIGCDICRA